MTLPFDPNTLFTSEGATEQQAEFGTTGTAGGGIASTPIPTPVPTPTIIIETCRPAGTFLGCSGTENIGIFSLGEQPDGGCLTEARRTSLCDAIAPTPTPVPTPNGRTCQGDGECPNGYYCDYSNPTFSEDLTNQFGVCTPVPVPTATVCPQQGIFLGCSEFPGLGIFAGGEPPPGQPCYTYTNNDSRCGEGCPPVGTFIRCTELQTALGGIAEFSNGLQGGKCSSYTQIDDRCTVQPTLCNYKDTSATCESVLGATYTGTAYRTVVVTDVLGNPLPTGCTPDVRIDTSWNTSECVPTERPVCEYVEETTQCSSLNGFSEYTGTASRTTLRVNSNGNALPLGCQPNERIDTSWNTTQCQPPNQSCKPPAGPFTQKISIPCVQIDSRTYNTGLAIQTQTRDYFEVSAATSETCPYKDWVNTELDTSQCGFVEATCTPPTGPFTRTVEISCTSVSENFVNGIALQTQVREFDSNSPPGTVCRYTEWVDSGQPDTTFCQLPNTPNICTPPSGPFTQEIIVPCSQIDAKFTQGTATQTQIRRYDASANIAGLCPYTEWENIGAPNVSTCTQPTFWRNCITGDLVEGTAPVNYTQVNYEKGGTCWEPVTELGFIPSLNETLRYTYQRGSSQLPESKTISVTNSSYGTLFTVKITTNPDIMLSVDNKPANKGTVVFNVGPRSQTKVNIIIGQVLLQQLQDGLSTLSMTVEYERVIV
jgi:hypothetical protein